MHAAQLQDWLDNLLPLTSSEKLTNCVGKQLRFVFVDSSLFGEQTRDTLPLPHTPPPPDGRLRYRFMLRLKCVATRHT